LDTYVEPFAGGAGAALYLLFGEFVQRIVLNDLDAGVAAFWRSSIEQTEAFVQLILAADLTIDEWRRQRAVFVAEPKDDLALGFATFYLNRTNRSGILRARPIGGLEQQGSWGIGARFNKPELAARIRRLARYRNRIAITCKHGVAALHETISQNANCFYYLDPPYLSQGRDLYLEAMSWDAHIELSTALRSSQVPWLVTYDRDQRVLNDLYPGCAIAEFRIAHTAANQHVGSEYAVFSPGLSRSAVSSFEAHWVARPPA
jgi:DNA adenine methylase